MADHRRRQTTVQAHIAVLPHNVPHHIHRATVQTPLRTVLQPHLDELERNDHQTLGGARQAPRHDGAQALVAHDGAHRLAPRIVRAKLERPLRRLE